MFVKAHQFGPFFSEILIVCFLDNSQVFCKIGKNTHKDSGYIYTTTTKSYNPRLSPPAS